MNLLIFHYIFSLSGNPYIANIALFFSYYLVWGTILILISWSLFFASEKIRAFFLFSFSGLAAVATSSLLKIIFLIQRPFVGLEDVVPLVRIDGFSFPSIHAALMAGLAAAGFSLDKKLGGVLIVFAALIGISRVVIGVHYPVDIVGGWLVGYVVARVCANICKKI